MNSQEFTVTLNFPCKITIVLVSLCSSIPDGTKSLTGNSSLATYNIHICTFLEKKDNKW